MHNHAQTGPRPCKDCGVPTLPWGWENWKGNNCSAACRCHSCYLALIRRRAQVRRAQNPPKPQATVRQCLVCGVETNRRKYCEPCALATKRERKREGARRRYRKGRTPSNWTRQCKCGTVFTNRKRGRYCSPDCPTKPRRIQDIGPIHGPELPPTRPCLRCGEPVKRTRKRCPECARLQNIERITGLYWIAAENVEIRKAQAWRSAIVKHLRERDGDRCALCSKVMKFDVATGPRGDKFGATLDHILPRSRGGGDGLENLQLAHWACNNRKGNRGNPEQLRLVG